MRTVNLFASGLLLFLSFFVHSVNAQNCTLPAPADMTVSFPNQTSARFDWTPVPGAWGYNVQVLNQNTAGVTTYSVQAPATHLIIQTDPSNSYQVAVRSKCSPESYSIYVIARNFISQVYIIVADVIPYNINCPFTSLQYELNQPLNSGQEYNSGISIITGEYYLFSFQYFDGNKKESVSGTIHRDAMEHVYIGEQEATWNTTKIDIKKILIGKDESAGIELSLHPITSFSTMGGTLYFRALNPNFRNFNIMRCVSGNGGEPGLETSNTTASNTLSSFQVSPNPFSDELTIQTHESSTQAFEARLFNTAGQLCLSLEVSREDANNKTFTLPTDALAPGMYYLHLSTGNGGTVVKKVVKM